MTENMNLDHIPTRNYILFINRKLIKSILEESY